MEKRENFSEIFEAPSEPYFFKNSSRFQGKFLESFIFNDSEIFYQLEARPVRQEGDALSRHIKFLIEGSKFLESEITCPFCKISKIKFLLFLDHRILDFKLSSCEDEACKSALKSGRPNSRLIPLNLNGLRQFRTKAMREKAESLFRRAFKIKKNASPIEVFELFNQAYLKNKAKEQEARGKTQAENEKSEDETLAGKSQAEPKKVSENSSLNLKSSEPPRLRSRYFSGRKSDARQENLF